MYPLDSICIAGSFICTPSLIFFHIKDIKKNVEVYRMRGDKKSVCNFGSRADTLKTMLQVLQLM